MSGQVLRPALTMNGWDRFDPKNSLPGGDWSPCQIKQPISKGWNMDSMAVKILDTGDLTIGLRVGLINKPSPILTGYCTNLTRLYQLTLV